MQKSIAVILPEYSVIKKISEKEKNIKRTIMIMKIKKITKKKNN